MLPIRLQWPLCSKLTRGSVSPILKFPWKHAVSSTDSSKENMKYFKLFGGFGHQAQVWVDCWLIYAIYIGTTVFIVYLLEVYRRHYFFILKTTCCFLLTKNISVSWLRGSWLLWWWQLKLRDVWEDLMYYKICLCLQCKIWHLMIIKELLDYLALPANNQMKSNERTALTVKFGLPTSDLEQDLNVMAVNNYNQWETKPAHKHFKSLLENWLLFFSVLLLLQRHRNLLGRRRGREDVGSKRWNVCFSGG